MDSNLEEIETCTILITQYLTGDGNVGYSIKRRGDANLSTQIGLLELAKLSIVEDFNQTGGMGE